MRRPIGGERGTIPLRIQAVGKLIPEAGTVASVDVLVRKLRSTSRQRRRSVHVGEEVPLELKKTDAGEAR